MVSEWRLFDGKWPSQSDECGLWSLMFHVWYHRYFSAVPALNAEVSTATAYGLYLNFTNTVTGEVVSTNVGANVGNV